MAVASMIIFIGAGWSVPNAHLEKKMLNLVWPRIEFNFGGLMNQLNLIELQISLEPHTSN